MTKENKLSIKDFLKAKLSFKQWLTLVALILLASWIIFSVSFDFEIGGFHCDSKPVKIKTDNVSVGVQQVPKK